MGRHEKVSGLMRGSPPTGARARVQVPKAVPRESDCEELYEYGDKTASRSAQCLLTCVHASVGPAFVFALTCAVLRAG